jgi:hypothetical protein
MIAPVRHHEIIKHAAGGISEQRVALPARSKASNIAGHQHFERARSILDAAGAWTERDLTHVRDIEQAGGGTGVQVLCDNSRRILEGHVIARELHHARAEPHVQAVQWRAT